MSNLTPTGDSHDTIINALRGILISCADEPNGIVHVMAATNNHAEKGDNSKFCIFAIQAGSKVIEFEENILERLHNATRELIEESDAGEVIEWALIQVPDDLDPTGRKVTMICSKLTHLGALNREEARISGIAQLEAASADTEIGKALRGKLNPEEVVERVRDKTKELAEAVREAEILQGATEGMVRAGVVMGHRDEQLASLVDSLRERLRKMREIHAALTGLGDLIEKEGVSPAVLKEVIRLAEWERALHKDDEGIKDTMAEDLPEEVDPGCPECRRHEEERASLNAALEALDQLEKSRSANAARIERMDKLVGKLTKKANAWAELCRALDAYNPGMFDSDLDHHQVVMRWIKESITIREQFKKSVADLVSKTDADPAARQ